MLGERVSGDKKLHIRSDVSNKYVVPYKEIKTTHELALILNIILSYTPSPEIKKYVGQLNAKPEKPLSETTVSDKALHYLYLATDDLPKSLSAPITQLIVEQRAAGDDTKWRTRRSKTSETYTGKT